MEDFSLNLLCNGKSHLLPLTLDSLKNQQSSFEILILNGEEKNLEDLLQHYQGLNLRIERTPAKNRAQMMNYGLFASRGKYIQFLEPGVCYISPQGLSYLTQQIIHLPKLIVSRGVIPEARAHWFLRSQLVEMGGFDEKIHLPMFDMLCRYKKWGIEPWICERALVDLPQDPIRVWEMCQILYRHFGLKVALDWLCQGRLHLHRLKLFLKSAFWQQ